MTQILSADHLTFHYPDAKPLFADLSLSVETGEVLTLLGPNGIGKSTLLKCLLGFLKPSQGTVMLDSEPIDHLDNRSRARKIAYVAQTVDQSCQLCVRDYVVTGRTPYLNFSQQPGDAEYQVATNALKQLAIADLASQPVNTLSGGQLQLVTIAKALVQQPELIILDEPTSALDFGRQRQVIELIKQLSNDNYAIILTTHNPNHAFMINQKVGLFGQDGQFQIGATCDLLTQENLQNAYQTQLTLLYVDELKRTICELP
ncbi:iron ABC transporter ATP-binding protein [Secundilactobacillus paracollinoides]|uniref:Iron ABC transporter ATP-binding protein n=1 Tax=Secundilactobacillus paracollinoides TaxID=240427 RepID=A0A1B2IVN9_9LACO|nr:ABC transporter ATP-binding protein [Secundilactobacillus paracollinoides]ANZ62753.1 iron ABC transporter ATP-binding protein [Secundilactobacillus paracollinoides]ANZ66089.1 iron ABC transporter ATP-binding protein [Secundilactobacillus paracollinoides]